jgi:hypothetical protein
MRNILICTIMTSLCILPGCGGDAMHFREQPSTINVPQAEFNQSPRQLYETAKRVVTSAPMSLPVEQEKSGSFITGYKEYPGEWHIARRWQERTRFRVSVIPDFDNPTSKARLEVAEETQTRAADVQEWKPSSDIARPERAKELLEQIQRQITTAPAK